MRPETEPQARGSRPSAHLGVCCLSPSPQFALGKLAELERWKQKLQDEAHTLIDFFCEDKDTVKLDECLQIFRDFCVKFNKAVKVRLCVFLFPASPLPVVERCFSSSGASGRSGPGGVARLSLVIPGKGSAVSAPSLSLWAGVCCLAAFAT